MVITLGTSSLAEPVSTSKSLWFYLLPPVSNSRADGLNGDRFLRSAPLLRTYMKGTFRLMSPPSCSRTGPCCHCFVFSTSYPRLQPASDSVSASASSASSSAPSSSASSSPDADAFLQNHFTIDESCTRTGKGIANGAKKRPMLEQAVKDAATLAHEAQSIQRTEFDHLQFVTIPASGSIRIEHPLSLKDILRKNPTVKFHEELKVRRKYRVWMTHSLLCSAGRYSYWGDIEVELKDKKLSSYSPN
ncbi:hypothetical protein C8J57DRAFT_1605991 [Mycena rebaudengoi]|nr:hypothetical protein C8J57DRAFT_1605991 [Mycena rebaudengoi]